MICQAEVAGRVTVKSWTMMLFQNHLPTNATIVMVITSVRIAAITSVYISRRFVGEPDKSVKPSTAARQA